MDDDTHEPIPARVRDTVIEALQSDDLTILDRLDHDEKRLARIYLERLQAYVILRGRLGPL